MEPQGELLTLGEDIQNDLDEFFSLRSDSDSKTAALKRLELVVGAACVKSASQKVGNFDELVRLQDSFEHNIPSRLLPWISTCSETLESLASSSKNAKATAGTDDEELNNNEHFSALKQLSAQTVLALSIIQGIVLNHSRSKKWLGKTKSLEIFVDLLLASRHVSSTTFTSLESAERSKSSQSGSFSSLTSTILDTILCVLVDSTFALRAFEECNGVQAVVKILKRAGTPREVRMKCLEFLYFYLLDETKPSSSVVSALEPSQTDFSPAPTVPNTPIRSGRSHSRSNSSHNSLFPPTVPNTPRESAHLKHDSRSLSGGVSHSSVSSYSSTKSTPSAGAISQPSTAPRMKAKKPYLNGLTAPSRPSPSPKPVSEYGSSAYSFPNSSYSGPSVGSENASEKGYITESNPGSRSNSNGDHLMGDGTTTTTVKSLRSVSSGSAQSFTSTSSVASAISTNSAGSSMTAPTSAESSPKKTFSALPPMLPTIPSGTVYKTPPGSPEMEFDAFLTRKGREPPTPSAPRTSATPLRSSKTSSSLSQASFSSSSSHLMRVPSSEKKQPVFSIGNQPRSLMMLRKEVDFIPQSPQKIDFGGGSAAPSPMSVGTVAGMAGRRARAHSRTRSALALGSSASSSARTFTSGSRGSSRERERGVGHMRARSVGRRESVLDKDSESAGGMHGQQAVDASSLGLVFGFAVAKAGKPDGNSNGMPSGSRGARMEIRPRTTEEKKEFLGTMLGNVDALVEGVRKAGIWGLA